MSVSSIRTNAGVEAARQAGTPGRVLRRARLGRRWSQQRLIWEMQQIGQRKGISLPTSESLKSMVSRWERGHQVPDEFNRRLLCEALGIALSDLGLPEDPDLPDAG